MQEREQKWDALHDEDRLCGAGTTNIIAKIMNGVAPGREDREKEKDETAGMDRRELEVSQHQDTT
jgi:hypothetical protein